MSLPYLIGIVDDDDDNAEVVMTALRKAGYEVKVAQDLAGARKLLEDCRPDLLILDRQLPDGDGLEFCMEVRSDPAYAGLPILFLSVKDSVRERVLGLDHGGDDYLPKPFGVMELQARVLALLRRAQRKPKP